MELLDLVAEMIYEWEQDYRQYKEWKPFGLLLDDHREVYRELAQRIIDVTDEFESVEENSLDFVDDEW